MNRANEAQLHSALQTALTLHQAGQLAQAEAIYRQIIAQVPQHPRALHLLGVMALQVGNPTAAEPLLRQSIATQPDLAETHCDLGMALVQLGNHDAASAEYRKAIQLKPDLSVAHNNLGHLLQQQGQLQEAIQSYQQAIRLEPNHLGAILNLGSALQQLGDLDGAIAALQTVLQREPNNVKATVALGVAFHDRGEHEAAIAMFRRAVDLAPDSPSIHSRLLYALHFSSNITPQQLREEHVRWSEKHAEPITRASIPPTIAPLTNRRIRLGYVSADLWNHSVGRFLLPLLRHHDRQRFEVFCYSDVRKPDQVTAELQGHADHWRNTHELDDESLAQQIRTDRIDVLVDLAAHTDGNRLLTFARRPAPLQISYLAYPGTTGMTAMDVRLTDASLDPDGNDEYYTEASVRLPRNYWCYDPPDLVATPGRSAVDPAAIRFGCLNNFAKVSQDCIDTWARLLAAVPGSRLLLHAHQGSHRQRVLASFALGGVLADRVSFVGFVSRDDYLRLYEQVDIALDPFPYNGGTTSLDALWMGVPLISLAGKIAVHRAGASVLASAGMPELITSSSEDYLHAAIDLAHDPKRLGRCHSSLRQRMKMSLLVDAVASARGLEQTIEQLMEP